MGTGARHELRYALNYFLFAMAREVKKARGIAQESGTIDISLPLARKNPGPKVAGKHPLNGPDKRGT